VPHTDDPRITREELALATRNAGMPLEALVHDATPVGLHYLLIHYDIPLADEAGWRLEVGGAVTTPLSLGMAELQARPRTTQRVTMECAGNGRTTMAPRALSQPWGLEAVGTGEWTGTPLRPLLDEAGLTADAVEVVFRGADRGVEGGIPQHYERSIRLDDPALDRALLVWGLAGGPLPPQHGFPLRLVVPGWYGMASVKWLQRITAVTTPFTGYQQAVAYRWAATEHDPGRPLSTIAVRSLAIPPGIPDFSTRRRHLDAGPHTVRGRAWSGAGEVVRVEVSTDRGATWADAEVGPPVDRFAWHPWTWRWDAAPGEHELWSRATDATGATQPIEPVWNRGGYAGNGVQRIPVTVTEPGGDLG
jgi:sulfane dehydrogenase subunit SoxC